MRIGTWNLNNRVLNNQHIDLLRSEQCDVWLLTEVNPKAVDSNGRIAGFHCHLSSGVMACGQHWAAVLSLQPLNPLADPHPASAAALVNGITYCSTVLPWGSCGNETPWVGKHLAEKTANTLDVLLAALPQKDLVWGGDWNQNLTGGWEHVGSKEGRMSLNAAVEALNLRVQTSALLHQLGTHSIDHIAVSSGWTVKDAERIATKMLSDHDAYVIEVCDSSVPPSSDAHQQKPPLHLL